MNTFRSIFLFAVGFLGCLAFEPVACGCAACFGRSDSSLAQGMNMGILALLVVVVCMWVTFSAFFIYLARRANTTAASQRTSPSISQTNTSESQ